MAMRKKLTEVHPDLRALGVTEKTVERALQGQEEGPEEQEKPDRSLNEKEFERWLKEDEDKS